MNPREIKEHKERTHPPVVASWPKKDGAVTQSRNSFYAEIMPIIYAALNQHIPHTLVDLVCEYAPNLNQCSIEVIEKIANSNSENELVIDARVRMGIANFIQIYNEGAGHGQYLDLMHQAKKYFFSANDLAVKLNLCSPIRRYIDILTEISGLGWSRIGGRLESHASNGAYAPLQYFIGKFYQSRISLSTTKKSDQVLFLL